MSQENGYQNIERLLENYEVPPQPQVLNALDEAFNQADPGVETLAVLISGDVALTSKIMQMANSQYLAINANRQARIETLPDAILLLGKHRIRDMIREMGYLSSLKSSGLEFEPFWDYSADVAIISSYLAQRLLSADPKEAYLLGLFHDAGILILMQGIPHYMGVVRPAGLDSQPIDPVLEHKKFGLDHQMVGYRLSLKWNFSPIISRSILTHHYLDHPDLVKDDFSYKKNVLISILQIAEKISYRFRSIWRDDRVILRTGEVNPYILNYLEIDKGDLEDLIEDAFDRVEELLQKHQR